MIIYLVNRYEIDKYNFHYYSLENKKFSFAKLLISNYNTRKLFILFFFLISIYYFTASTFPSCCHFIAVMIVHWVMYDR